ncbi:MAG: manganese-binding transcriptional regulator MntR [Phycisphaerales bacterium]
MAATKGRSGRSRRAGTARGADDAERSAEASAQGHRRTRQAHVTETAQDYVEAVADLIETRGEARVVDLARRLGVTHVTITQTIARLKKQGLLRSEPYRSIFLTDAGRAMAMEARRRHEIVLSFLRAIGVPEAIAQTDAEGIEHHVSPETLAAMQRLSRRRGR